VARRPGPEDERVMAGGVSADNRIALTPAGPEALPARHGPCPECRAARLAAYRLERIVGVLCGCIGCLVGTWVASAGVEFLDMLVVTAATCGALAVVLVGADLFAYATWRDED
jgi:hypothetical protein